mmetsp:Transcript_142900/g.249278  ORF Transcript_142900/g.249278 Transcript_142900/m.249278 type:complete len:260 (-) Transcript_142900:829-1608(-)
MATSYVNPSWPKMIAVMGIGLGIAAASDVVAQALEYKFAKRRAKPLVRDAAGATVSDSELDTKGSLRGESDLKGFKLDIKRLLVWIAWPNVGDIFFGTLLWARWVPNLLGTSTNPLEITGKVLVKTAGRALSLAVAMAGNRLIAGNSVNEVCAKLKQDWLSAWLWSTAVLMPADVIQFAFIPPLYQILWLQVYKLFSGVIVSHFINLELEHPLAAALDSHQTADPGPDHDDSMEPMATVDPTLIANPLPDHGGPIEPKS